MDCAICLSTLAPPIRMLGCGHSFCEACLKQLVSSYTQKSCPRCRHDFGNGFTNVESLPRVYDLENLLETTRMNAETQNQNECQRASSNEQSSSNKESPGDAIWIELSDHGLSYINDGKFEDALYTFQALINSSDEEKKILPLLYITKCCVELGRIDEANQNLIQAESLLASKGLSDFMKSKSALIENLALQLLTKLLEKKEIGCLILAVNFLFMLIKTYRYEKRRNKLEHLAQILTDITLQHPSSITRGETQQIDLLINEILSEI